MPGFRGFRRTHGCHPGPAIPLKRAPRGPRSGEMQWIVGMLCIAVTYANGDRLTVTVCSTSLVNSRQTLELAKYVSTYF